MSPLRLMFAAAASLAATAAAAQTPVQHVELRSYAYGPKAIRLAAGKPVTLHFMNRAGKAHDFTAPRFFAAARILSGSAPRGQIELAAGQTAAITLVPSAGTFKVHCGHPFHKQLGMSAVIEVR
ncbi:MAG: cupredoxin domain-containing protein [Sphingomicrobium sp.]